MEKNASEKFPVQIVVAIIGAIAMIIVAYFTYQASLAPKRLEIETTQTAEVRLTLLALTPPTSTNTPLPTKTFTPPTPDNTLQISAPLTPLQEIFPQLGDGVEFIFPDKEPNLIKRQFLEVGNCRHSPPYSIQITYNFTQGSSGGWGVHWNTPPSTHFTAAGFNTFTFWVLGASGNEEFQIGMKDTGQIDVKDDEKEIKVDSSRYVYVSASEWKQVEIPLSHFADSQGPIDITSIDNINFGFNQLHGAGSICIDDIAFISK